MIMQPFSVFGSNVFFVNGTVGGVLSLKLPSRPRVTRIPSLRCAAPCFYRGIAYIRDTNTLVLVDYLHPRVVAIMIDSSDVRDYEIPWRLIPARPTSVCVAWDHKLWLSTREGDFKDDLILLNLQNGSPERLDITRGWEPPLVTMGGGTLVVGGGRTPVLYDASLGSLQWLQSDLSVAHQMTLGMEAVVGSTATGNVIVLEKESCGWLVRQWDLSARLIAVARLEEMPLRSVLGITAVDDGTMVVMGDGGELFVSTLQGKWSKMEIDYTSFFYEAMKDQSQRGQ